MRTKINPVNGLFAMIAITSFSVFIASAIVGFSFCIAAVLSKMIEVFG